MRPADLKGFGPVAKPAPVYDSKAIEADVAMIRRLDLDLGRVERDEALARLLDLALSVAKAPTIDLLYGKPTGDGDDTTLVVTKEESTSLRELGFRNWDRIAFVNLEMSP